MSLSVLYLFVVGQSRQVCEEIRVESGRYGIAARGRSSHRSQAHGAVAK